MAITIQNVQHTAKLSNLAITDEEAEKMANQLGKILDYINMLNEVNTDNVSITANINLEKNKLRADVVHQEYDRTQMLVCSPLEVENHCVKVHKIL